MPPPTANGSGPGPSAALLPCRSKAQKLRASSSNSLCFLTPGRAKGLIALGPNGPDPTPAEGSVIDTLMLYFLIERKAHGNP